MSDFLPGLITFAFVAGLLFFSGLCYLGVRNDRAPWSILAIVAFAALVSPTLAYLMDLARLWAGHSREQSSIGAEAVLALLYIAWRHRRWIGEGRAIRAPARLPRALRGHRGS